MTTWVQGQKRPDGQSLVKLLVTFKGWFGGGWDPLEALDAIACLGYDWCKVQEVCARHFQKGGILEHVQTWWEAARPAQRTLLPPAPTGDSCATRR